MVRAEYVGCGKSYACKEMEKRGHKVLFVCPTNRLSQNNKENGVTLNRFFSVGMKNYETIVTMMLLFLMKFILLIYICYQESRNIAKQI